MIEKPTHAFLYMDPVDDYPRPPINWTRWGMAIVLTSLIVAEGVFLADLLTSDS